MEESDSEINSEDRHQPSDAQNGFAANRGIDDRLGPVVDFPKRTQCRNGDRDQPRYHNQTRRAQRRPYPNPFIRHSPSPDSLADLSARPEQNGSEPLRILWKV